MTEEAGADASEELTGPAPFTALEPTAHPPSAKRTPPARMTVANRDIPYFSTAVWT